MKDQRGESDSFHCYGAPLLAVADGVVDSIRGGLPDNRPLSSTMAVPITADTLAGNFVLLDIGGAQVLYGHVMPGSISVKSGQHVRRGQVLARLGNSGNSDAPHPHLQVIDLAPAHVPATVAPLAGEGIAFAFRDFTFRGRIDDLDAFIASDQRWAPDARGARPMSGLPLAGDVIAFDQGLSAAPPSGLTPSHVNPGPWVGAQTSGYRWRRLFSISHWYCGNTVKPALIKASPPTSRR